MCKLLVAAAAAVEEDAVVATAVLSVLSVSEVTVVCAACAAPLRDPDEARCCDDVDVDEVGFEVHAPVS